MFLKRIEAGGCPRYIKKAIMVINVETQKLSGSFPEITCEVNDTDIAENWMRAIGNAGYSISSVEDVFTVSPVRNTVIDDQLHYH